MDLQIVLAAIVVLFLLSKVFTKGQLVVLVTLVFVVWGVIEGSSSLTLGVINVSSHADLASAAFSGQYK